MYIIILGNIFLSAALNCTYSKTLIIRKSKSKSILIIKLQNLQYNYITEAHQQSCQELIFIKKNKKKVILVEFILKIMYGKIISIVIRFSLSDLKVRRDMLSMKKNRSILVLEMCEIKRAALDKNSNRNWTKCPRKAEWWAEITKVWFNIFLFCMWPSMW